MEAQYKLSTGKGKIMIKVPGGKGKLCAGGLDAIPDLLERAAQMAEQQRLAAEREATPESSEENPSFNGKTTAQSCPEGTHNLTTL